MRTPNQKHIICTVTSDLTYDQRMIRICTSLYQAGYEVSLVGPTLGATKNTHNHPYQEVTIKVDLIKGKKFYIQYHFALKKWLSKQKCALLYAVDLDTLAACAKVSKKNNIPLVYDAHEYFTELPELLGRPFVKKIWSYIANRYIPQAQTCLTVSKTLGEALQQKYKKPFQIIRNVPTLKRRNKALGKNKKIILYQGALNKGRGLEAAILAMKQIKGASLWLVGMGDLDAALRKLVEVEKLQDKVIFKGHLEPHKLVDITNDSWIGINLLEGESLNYFYSLANKFFDYMMAGIPSLNMNFPEYKMILKDHPMGVLLAELTPNAIAKEINYLLEHPAEYDKLCQRTEQAKIIFNWEQEEVKLIALIKEVLTS